MDYSFGQDIDSFIMKYIVDEDKKLASVELNLIVLKALRLQLEELQDRLIKS